MDKGNLWKFGTREIVYSAIGAALYGVLSWVFNGLQLPGTALVSIRPPIAIPMFMGVMFGPLVGLFSGGIGNVIGDLLSGYGFFWAWDVGNGLIGLVCGLLPMVGIGEIKTRRDYLFVALAAAVSSFVGLAFPAWAFRLASPPKVPAVQRKSLKQDRAASMPDAVWPVSRHRPD